MKRIVCELCDGMEFAKVDGMFVCQSCGTKYSVEEAKALMREVEGDAPAVSASAAPEETSHKAQIENLYALATSAFEASNNQETETYCNKIIELDASCYQAWLLKGKAIGWSSTYGNSRIEEAAKVMLKAVEVAPDTQTKEAVVLDALDATTDMCLAITSLAQDSFSKGPDKKDRMKFMAARDTAIKTNEQFLHAVPHSLAVAERCTQTLKIFARKAAEHMYLAGSAALCHVRGNWKAVSWPNKNTWDAYLDGYEEIAALFEQSIKWGEAAEEEEDALIARHKNLIVAKKEPIDSKCYRQVWNSYSGAYEWAVDYYLSDSAKASRRRSIYASETAISKLKEQKSRRQAEAARKAAEEKSARVAAYWEKFPEEKAQLEKQLQEQKDRKKELEAQIDNLDAQFSALKKEKEKEKVPSEEEREKLLNQIHELRVRRDSLGLFAGKEKKQIEAEIEELDKRQYDLRPKIVAEKKERDLSASKEQAPLLEQRNAYKKEHTAVKEKIAELENELTKDR